MGAAGFAGFCWNSAQETVDADANRLFYCSIIAGSSSCQQQLPSDNIKLPLVVRALKPFPHFIRHFGAGLGPWGPVATRPTDQEASRDYSRRFLPGDLCQSQPGPAERLAWQTRIFLVDSPWPCDCGWSSPARTLFFAWSSVGVTQPRQHAVQPLEIVGVSDVIEDYVQSEADSRASIRWFSAMLCFSARAVMWLGNPES